MPIEISVGPPVCTINQGSTFMVTDLNGEIASESEQGVFAGDTRFVSYYALTANGEPWTRVTSSATTYYSSRLHMTNRKVVTEDGEIPEGTMALSVIRAVSDGIHEDIDLTNYNQIPVRFNFEIGLRSDFADLFDVKSHRFARRGHIVTQWDADEGELSTSYDNKDFHRTFMFRLSKSDSPATYSNGRVSFDVELAPGATWHTCADYVLVQGERVREPAEGCVYTLGNNEYDALQRQWLASATTLSSANEDVYRLFRQSVEDMGALRIHDLDFAADVWLPAAGVPWFVTVFGRDSLIVSIQNMLVYPKFAFGALKKLAQFQATEMDDYRDAEPGKMPHEIRFGELAHFKKIPHTPYYGTADATPLYLIALHEAWKWLGDDSLLREYRQVAEGCLAWIDNHGDLDGDGFQEYKTRSTLGYENVGWKDAGDSILYPDGSLVHQPKALCELQGYVFDAWMRMAEVFDALGEPNRSAELRRKAADLQARFEAKYWCESEGFYALTLDPDKKPVPTIASNAGHCLWSGLVRPDRAAHVVKRFFEPDMWSGWGIRTMTALNPAYNPFEYQRGSVWPHDNGIIALGMKRYGFHDEAARIARDISEAASYFVSYRLPELYSGVERTPGSFPVQYRGANVPQAWAAGTVFHLIQAILGIQADAPNGRLYVDPQLPRWLPDITLKGVHIGPARADLHFWRDGDQTRWDANVSGGEVEVQQQAWAPWSPATPATTR
ncbi:MAG: glycogen debranching N-terminal domain-containing protein [Chloroflexota bacterium]